MTKITEFNIGKLRIEEDFGFQKRVEAETALLTAEADKAIVEEYKSALAAFDTALEQNAANSHTAAVVEADEKADAAWSGLNAHVKNMTGYPSDEVRAVAVEAQAIVKKYGFIITMPYNEEYGRMHNLLQDLEALGSEALAKIYADGWVAELKKQYEAFMTASSARAAEDALKVTGAAKQARTAADAAYRLLVDKVNALALINGEAAYEGFISRINVIVAEAKTTLAARKTNAAKKADSSSSSSGSGTSSSGGSSSGSDSGSGTDSGTSSGGDSGSSSGGGTTVKRDE